MSAREGEGEGEGEEERGKGKGKGKEEIGGEGVKVKAVEITEATPTADAKDLLFTIIAHSIDGSAGTVIRSYAHFAWINTKVGNAVKEIILPSLPEPPNPSLISDPDSCEKKKKQLARYLSKLVARPEAWKSEDLKIFLTAPTINLEAPPDALSTATNMLTSFTNFSYSTDNGLKIFKPTLLLDDLDETDFDKRKMYIFQSERDHKIALETIATLFRTRNALGRSFLYLGQQLSDLDREKYFGGILLPVNGFGIKMNGIHLEQVKNDIFQFGDIVLEYRGNSNVKALMNRRTDLLMECENAAKILARATENVEKLRKKLPEHAPEVISAFEERDKAKEALEKLQTSYEQFRKDMKQEFARYEQGKSSDFKQALDHYVRSQITYEKKKLDCLSDLLAQIKTK